MKFGKRLKHHVKQSLPEWRDKFVSYKEMKKVLKLISAGASEHGKAAESEFVYLLNNEMEKFNAFFMEQEEDFVIRHKELPRRIQKVVAAWGPNGTQPSESVYKTELAKIRNDVVNFHGEMVLLINYSNINYTGLTKILKKYDKRTGGVLRLPFIQKVLKQPFFTTDLISKLVKECETTIESIFPPCGDEGTLKLRRETRATAGDGVLGNTVAALVMMQEMRSISSTYSHFSLPPLNLPDFDVIQSLEVRSPIQIP